MARTKNAEIITKQNETAPAEIIIKDDNTIDTTQIADPNLRFLVESLIRETKEREAELEANLKKIKAELEQERRIRKLKMPPTQEWSNHIEGVMLSVEEANAVPLNDRQRKVLGKSIRMICREISGKYMVNKKRPEELILMKAAANRLGEAIAEFGVPEETDPAYKRISEKKIVRKKKTV